MSSLAKQKSDLSRAFSEDGANKTHVGGQALIEGVMMRGKYNWAVGVREPDGAIYEEQHDLSSGQAKNGWMYWPLVRGCRAMMESLVLGYKALEIAAIHAFNEDEENVKDAAAKDGVAGGGAAADCAEQAEPAKRDGVAETVSHVCGRDADVADGQMPVSNEPAFSWKDDFGRPDTMIDALGAQRSLDVVSEPSQPSEAKAASAPAAEDDAVFGKKEMAVSMVLGLVMGVVLFIVAPAFITNLLVGEYDSNTLAWNVVDGILRVAVFVFYIWLIGRMSDIKRMFGYHGAEHKTIHCYEHGLPLTPENARQFPAWGVPDGAPKLVLVIVARIVLMPVIAGISYEITVRWAGSHPDNPLVKVVLWPGMQMQYLTTNEPDDGMLECAIAAMKQVLEREEQEAAKATGAVEG